MSPGGLADAASPSRPHTQNGMSTGEAIELVAWKLRLKWRHAVDRRRSYMRFTRKAERWSDAWRARNGDAPDSLARWLNRREGGRFWFPVTAVSQWARSSCTPADIDIAERATRGEFQLLGATTVQPAATPLWRRDLYSGYDWPLTDGFSLNILRDDGSDIRTVWEMSRCYHLLPLARAYWSTGAPQFRDTFVNHIDSWIASNPVGYGPNWACPMDVALRAANWVVALALFAEADEIPAAFRQRMLSNLYATGLFLERYPEWHPVYRGNHYVANAVGLVYLGSLFKDDPAGARWLRTGADTLATEIERQVCEDGVSFEASLGYHRLVTELFTYGSALVRLNASELWPSACENRLRSMYRFMDTYLPSTGDAPLLGDADDGRVHAVSAESMQWPRKHRLGLSSDLWPASEPTSARFPDGGYYVVRSGHDHMIVRCGRVGLHGAGCHDHNDQLSYELALGGRRIVTDSGTYAYTRDLRARFAFRSTAAHNAVQLGHEEQNPITPGRPWRVLDDRTRSECTRWEIGPERQIFEGRHFGYAHRASHAVVSRSIALHTAERRWQITDEIEGDGVEALTWRLHLAACTVVRCTDSNKIVLPGTPTVVIDIDAPPGLSIEVSQSDASDRYGVRYTRPCLVLSGLVQLPARIKATFSVEEM